MRHGGIRGNWKKFKRSVAREQFVSIDNKEGIQDDLSISEYRIKVSAIASRRCIIYTDLIMSFIYMDDERQFIDARPLLKWKINQAIARLIDTSVVECFFCSCCLYVQVFGAKGKQQTEAESIKTKTHQIKIVDGGKATRTNRETDFFITSNAICRLCSRSA